MSGTGGKIAPLISSPARQPPPLDHTRELLKQEMLPLLRQVSRTESMLLECTKIMLKDDSDPAFRLEVLEAYEYIKVLKERAAIATRLLIAEHGFLLSWAWVVRDRKRIGRSMCSPFLGGFLGKSLLSA